MPNAQNGLKRKLDAQGRLSLPTSIMKRFPEDIKTFVVTVSPRENCLYIFEPEAFEDWLNSLFVADGGYCPTNLKHADLRSKMASRAVYTDRDNNDRIVITAEQRKCAELDGEVTVFKNINYIEVWSTKCWDEHNKLVDVMSLFS